MKIDRVKAKKVFDDYVKNYNSNDEKIKLKIDHTYRVSDLCEKIALSLGMNNEDVDIAWLTGLLHDIGRFEQVKRYGTFNDPKSVDHAKLGSSILFSEGKIDLNDIELNEFLCSYKKVNSDKPLSIKVCENIKTYDY